MLIGKVLCAFGRYNYGDINRGQSYEYSHFLPAWMNISKSVIFFDTLDRNKYENYSELNRDFLKFVETEQPDIIFCSLMCYEIWLESLDQLKNRTTALIINWGTDDSWKFDEFSFYVSQYVHLHVTTSEIAFNKSIVRGLKNVLLSQWAADKNGMQKPIPSIECKYKVSFIGTVYGNRKKWIDALRNGGVNVDCFGYGWPNGVIDSSDISKIMRNSIISLNFGDSGLIWKGLNFIRSRQIKARIFEVPAAGGFLLTEYSEYLENYFKIGKEIVTFNGVDDLLKKIHYYILNDSERNNIAIAGYERVNNEHTYEKRFLNIIDEAIKIKNINNDKLKFWNIDWDEFEVTVKNHQLSYMLIFIRYVLIKIFAIFISNKRARRGARRFIYEISWRLKGEYTFTSKGWPGRLFPNI